MHVSPNHRQDAYCTCHGFINNISYTIRCERFTAEQAGIVTELQCRSTLTFCVVFNPRFQLHKISLYGFEWVLLALFRPKSKVEKK